MAFVNTRPPRSLRPRPSSRASQLVYRGKLGCCDLDHGRRPAAADEVSILQAACSRPTGSSTKR